LIKLERIKERENFNQGEIKLFRHFYFWGGGQGSLEESKLQLFVITPIYICTTFPIIRVGKLVDFKELIIPMIVIGCMKISHRH
jgi:hypothetical protein